MDFVVHVINCCMCVYVFNALMLLIAHQEGQIKKKMAIKVIMYVIHMCML